MFYDGRLYIKVLGLSTNNPSAQRLRNWKDPRKYHSRFGGAKSSQSSGDFPALLEEELQVLHRIGPICGDLSMLALAVDGICPCWGFIGDSSVIGLVLVRIGPSWDWRVMGLVCVSLYRLFHRIAANN